MNRASDAPAFELSRACTALWTATLSLMTAFMQTAAPAHRYLLARRIARNLATLHDQDCFTLATRQVFDRLAQHWSDKADQLDPRQDCPRTAPGTLRPGWFN